MVRYPGRVSLLPWGPDQAGSEHLDPGGLFHLICGFWCRSRGEREGVWSVHGADREAACMNATCSPGSGP